MSTRVAQVGVHGFGRVHLEHLRPLRDSGRVELVAVADPAGPSDLVDVECYGTLTELLTAHSPEVVMIATPIGTHATLATEALRAGADVYLEKPPTPSLGDHYRLVRQLKETGQVVQVGFQALGGHGLARVRELMGSGALGEVTAVLGYGAWTRAMRYYRRARWAGRRTLDGVRVADGVATNPLAHSVSVALNLAGITSADTMTVTTELYQAHGIETDDTAFVRIDQPGALPVSLGLTTCAPEQRPPWVEVVGSRGRARLYYTDDVVELELSGDDAGPSIEQHGRSSLVENLLDHRDRGTALIAPLVEQAPFTVVLEAIQSGPEPTAIAQEFITWTGAGARPGAPATEQPDDAVPVVQDVEGHLLDAIRTGRGLRAVGTPWATAEPASWREQTALRTLTSSTGAELAVYVDGADIIAESSPRPYFHPVRSAAGAVITETHPADHNWHCGLGIVIPDVADRNFWGGRSYRHEDGYQWRADHGTITHQSFAAEESGPEVSDTDGGQFTEVLDWTADGVQLREDRTVRWEFLDEGRWQLDIDSTLTPVTPAEVELGSPGSHGRPGGGYGGWFIRLAPCTDAQIVARLADGTEVVGEHQVHGLQSPELTWEATFDGRRVRLTFSHLDDSLDPWFVRASEYNGVGSSVAWDEPVLITKRSPLRRSVRLVVADMP